MEKLQYPKVCKYKGENHVITTKQKDFTTKKEYYFLKGISDRIPVDQITLIQGEAKKNKSPKIVELVALRAAYQEAIGKEVPKNKKNDRKWLGSKIEEVLSKDDELNFKLSNDDELNFELLAAMNLKDLNKVIIDFDLEIDPEDFLTEEAPDDLLYLAEEVAAALNIEFPSRD